MRDEASFLLIWAVFLFGSLIGFISGAVVSGCKKDHEWTQYVIENGAMEWHCDSKTGETVLRWKE